MSNIACPPPQVLHLDSQICIFVSSCHRGNYLHQYIEAMKALILFLLLSFGAVVSATAVGQDDMFTVDNQVNQPLGTVTINYTSGSTSLNVPSQGIFQTSI